MSWLDRKHRVLNWMALLLKNRTFNLQDEIAIDVSHYAVVIGYRADDSFFCMLSRLSQYLAH